jgi:hypothetical protein
MRRRNILIGTLTLAVVVTTIGGVVYVLHTTSYPGLLAPVSVVCPGSTYRTPAGDGDPAIRPRNDCMPSFTQQDVRDYVAHGLQGHLGGYPVDGQPTATRVVFLTFDELEGGRFLGGGVYSGAHYPADMLVCYADVSGTFLYHDRFGSSNSPLSSISRAFIVFDAHSGNQIGYGLGTLLS